MGTGALHLSFLSFLSFLACQLASQLSSWNLSTSCVNVRLTHRFQPNRRHFEPHGPRSIETAIAARQAMAEAVASHSFGSVITPAGPESRWLVVALARFVSQKYLGQAFGKTYYQFRLAQDAEETSLHCDDYPPLSDPWCGNTSTPALLDFVAKRGCMILHMVESRVGADILADTIRTLAQDASGVVLAKKKAA
eukprot:COSAG02_NODE_6265_length_3694_cov_7.168567_2_plen_194_part_00